MTMTRSLALASSLALLCLSTSCAAQAQPDPMTTPQKEQPMMVIRVLVTIKPDQRDAFLTYMAQESLTVRALDGCIRYQVYSDASSPDSFMLYEEWADADTFHAYQNSPLLGESFKVLGPMMAAPPNSAYYEATNIKK
jgi:quinol monooxygenase YgiN